MNPLHWGIDAWGLLAAVLSVVGIREWVKRMAPLQRWMHWRNRR